MQPKRSNLLNLLKPYTWTILLLVFLTILPSALNLLVPKIIANAIDDFQNGKFVFEKVVIEFSIIAFLIFIFTYVQSIVQVYTSERVAKNLRTKLNEKISLKSYSFIEQITQAKLLTNLTSDVDSVKTFISQAIGAIISSIFIIIGASVLLLLTDWKLAIMVLSILPIIGGTFFFVLSKVRKLFTRAQEAIDWLNKLIDESIIGGTLIRIVNSQTYEYHKFLKANTEARDISLSILSLFASLIPIINFLTNIATLIIIIFGGHFVITGSLTLGGFTAFNSYLSILIFPIIIIGFMSNVIAQANASYGRIEELLNSPDLKEEGEYVSKLKGDVSVLNATFKINEKNILKDVSFEAKEGTKTAIIGPTAAGKTQLLYLIAGLIKPSSGSILYDGINIKQYNKKNLYSQVGLVFQDSILFNITLRENIAFSNSVNDESLKKAIETSELWDFIDSLPLGLDTVISERGVTLSGGQKQRVMLARALALDPKVLLLDDFTSRVDLSTEKKILENVRKNYPKLTLISVTQKIISIEDYDQILLLEEGEVLAKGKHGDLINSSPEYVQIYNSQSTEHI